MIGPEQVHRLLRTLAAHPVLPAMDRLPANDEDLHALLAELAGGERSRYAELVGQVAGEAGITPEELAGRAEFLLACLILPRAGTYYDMLGVASTANPEEIRKRWATLIQRYHPDHFESSDGWVTEQARRLIEAYQTLRDPERRRRYDAALASERAALPAPRRSRNARRVARQPRPMRRWVPPALIVVGLAGVSGLYVWHAPPPLPQAALPPAPKLLEGRQRPAFMNSVVLPSPSRSTPQAEKAPEPEPSPSEMPEPSQEPAPGSDWQSARMDEVHTPQEMPTRTAMRHEPPSPAAIAGGPRAQAVPQGSSPDPTPAVQNKSLPRRGVQAPPAALQPEQIPAKRRPAAEPEEPLPREGPTVSPEVGSTPPVADVSLEPDQRASRVAPAEDDPLRLIETFRAAYERKDLGAVMRLFASAPREREAVGRAAVQARYAQNFEALDQIHYELTRLETTAAAANDALVVRGWFRIRAVRRDNPSQLVDAAGVVRWHLRREANSLRIAEVHYELSRP